MRRGVALAFLLIACASAQAQAPRFEPGGFDAEILGAESGHPLFPRGRPMARHEFVGTFSNYDRVWQGEAIPKPPSASPLKRAPEPAIAWEFQGTRRTLDEYLAAHPTTAFLIAKGDTILVERYRYGRREDARFTSFSMAKTLTAMLMGIAIAEGNIRSIDDVAETYVPELRGTEYGRTPLQALLSMASGLAFKEDYSGQDDAAKLARGSFVRMGPGGPGILRQFDTRAVAPDTKFNYAGGDTQTLGAVLQAATGMSLAAYAAEKLWTPLGAEAGASWLTDNAGMAAAFCCFQATLRDWARVGLMLAHDGAWNGAQIVPRDWVRMATRADPARPHLWPGTATPFFGYGYQTWIFPRNTGGFALLGIYGQSIYVDPEAKLVMVHLAARARPSNNPEGA
ncbi:MAG: beta-lactamase family protein, partial [Tagaea sp.]|nr:beta-lactamase family protein [Tagaea sp.]